MQLVEMYSILELLSSRTINWNKAKLAKILGIQRNTLVSYEDDVECKNHGVMKIDGKYIFRSNTSSTKTLRN